MAGSHLHFSREPTIPPTVDRGLWLLDLNRPPNDHCLEIWSILVTRLEAILIDTSKQTQVVVCFSITYEPV